MLIVVTHHVDFAVRHLERVYDDPVMGYNRYSAKEKARGTLVNPEGIETAIKLGGRAKTKELIHYLLAMQNITRLNLEEFVGERLEAHTLWSTLLSSNCLAHNANGLSTVKTRPFVGLLEKMARAFEKVEVAR